MAYLVVVIGVLMSLIGLFAAVSGYTIIEVERGWATLISGSTLLAGGLVTIALGLVLKTLLAIKSALDARPVETLRVTADRTADFEPISRGAATGALAAPAFADALASDHDSSWLETAHSETNYAEPAAPAREMPRLHALDDEPYEPAFANPAFPEPAFHETVRQDFASHEPEVEPPHEADAYELQSPSTPSHDLMPIEHEPPPAAPAPSAEDDWLDRAFSDLDRELAVGGHPARADTVAAPAEVEQLPIAEHATPPVDHDAPETAPALDAPSLTETAVIGRYDSEGTSYVMYADGSIEAQSEAGIYRFKSMAELKSFIEG